MGNCDNFDIIVREVGSENENGEVDDRVGLLVVGELSTIQAHFYADKYCFLFFYYYFMERNEPMLFIGNICLPRNILIQWIMPRFRYISRSKLEWVYFILSFNIL